MISSLSRFGTSLPAYSTKPASSLPHARTTVNNPSTSIQRQGITSEELHRFRFLLDNNITLDLEKQIRFYLSFIAREKKERERLVLSWLSKPNTMEEALGQLSESTEIREKIRRACYEYNTFLLRATKKQALHVTTLTQNKLEELLHQLKNLPTAH
jgi:hypothetical protein